MAAAGEIIAKGIVYASLQVLQKCLCCPAVARCALTLAQMPRLYRTRLPPTMALSFSSFQRYAVI